MDINQPTSQILLGGVVGLVSAVIAIGLQIRISSRRKNSRNSKLPGCIILVSGCLGGTGLMMAASSLFLTGGIGLAVAPGLGVLGGFFAGSGAMIVLRLLSLKPLAGRQMVEVRSD